MSATALINIFGIALVMPFLAVIASPESIHANHKISMLYTTFGFTQDLYFIVFLGALALVMLIITDTMAAVTTWLSAKVVSKIMARLTQRLYENYLDKEYSFFLEYNSSTLTNNLFSLSKDVSFGYLLSGMSLLSNILSIAAIVILIAYVNFAIASITVLIFGGSYLGLYFCVRKTLEQGGKARVQSSEAAYKLVSESFGGMKDIKLKGSENVFKALLYPKLLEMNNFEALRQIMLTMPKYILEVIAFGGVILIILMMLVSGYTVSTIIPLIALYVYSGYRLMPALQVVFSSFANIKVSQASLLKIYESYTFQSEGVREMVVPKISFMKNIKVKKLSYKYEGTNQNVLSNVDFTIARNEVVGFIGATGAGKSTLIDILLGLLVPSSGAVLIDGVALVSREKVRSWQALVGYVPQTIFLSDASILENIAFGEDPNKIDIGAAKKAAEIAAIHGFITNQLPDGYSTQVGERGIKLSGGQIQRIGIARALYRKPSVLILDEATSSLDEGTELEVMRAIYNMRDDITIIVIAHRLSTVQPCNKIYLIDSGRIIDEGRLSEVMNRLKKSQGGFNDIPI